MSNPDVSPVPAPDMSREPGFAGHLGRILLLCCALLAGTYLGALVAAFAGGSAAPFAAALDRADDVSGPLVLFAAIAFLLAGFRAALGEGMARRRRLVALRRRARSWGWLAHLLWIPALIIIVTAEGWVLIMVFATPLIVAGLVLGGSALSSQALRAGPITYAVVAVIGLAIGLVA